MPPIRLAVYQSTCFTFLGRRDFNGDFLMDTPLMSDLGWVISLIQSKGNAIAYRQSSLVFLQLLCIGRRRTPRDMLQCSWLQWIGWFGCCLSDFWNWTWMNGFWVKTPGCCYYIKQICFYDVFVIYRYLMHSFLGFCGFLLFFYYQVLVISYDFFVPYHHNPFQLIYN